MLFSIAQVRFVGDPERARTAGPTQPGLGLAVCHPRPTVVEMEDEGFPIAWAVDVVHDRYSG